ELLDAERRDEVALDKARELVDLQHGDRWRIPRANAQRQARVVVGATFLDQEVHVDVRLFFVELRNEIRVVGPVRAGEVGQKVDFDRVLRLRCRCEQQGNG